MVVEDPASARFEVVLVSDDRDHARHLLADLRTSRHPFVITRVRERRNIAAAFDRLVEALPRRMPVIVLLDFEFLGHICESVVARALGLKDRAALECIVTRPPPIGRLVERLKRMGAFVFDPDLEFATPEPLLH